MADNSIVRRLRGAFRNALVWGVAWFAVAVVLIAALRAFGVPSGGFTWAGALFLAFRFGVIGFIAGGVFSSVIRLLYHGRRLSEISWVRFGLLGGIATGLFVPVFLQAMNLLSGDGLVPWKLVLDDGLWTAVFGGAAAAGSLRLAQYADAALAGGSQDRVARLEGADRPAAGGRGPDSAT